MYKIKLLQFYFASTFFQILEYTFSKFSTAVDKR